MEDAQPNGLISRAEDSLDFAARKHSSKLGLTAHSGSWVWDAVAQKIVFDQRFRDLNRLPEKSFCVSLVEFLDRLDPADAKQLRQKLTDGIAISRAFRAVYRLRGAAGRLELCGTVLDSGGDTADFGGVCSDDASVAPRTAGTDIVDAKSLREIKIASGVQGAAQRDELRAFYQPVIDLDTGLMIGAEALVRWQHPELGWIMPAEIIPAAQKLGVSNEIGWWMLNQACAQAKNWSELPVSRIPIAINLSAAEFEAENFVPTVEAALKTHDVDPRWLMIEITENMMMGLGGHVENVIRELRNMGFAIAIDDFGTGFSSLSYLQRFSVDYLKIDHSFVAGLPANRINAAIARTIIAIADNLAMGVIAEGVETREQLEFLRAEGCTEVQGYFLSRPMPAAEITDQLLRDHSRFATVRRRQPRAVAGNEPSGQRALARTAAAGGI